MTQTDGKRLCVALIFNIWWMSIHSRCFLSCDGNAWEDAVNPNTSISLKKKTLDALYAQGILQIAKGSCSNCTRDEIKLHDTLRFTFQIVGSEYTCISGLVRWQILL